ncbi:MBL fold metallo-hydrolase [Iodidimonas sp. SYSU 1G8]|uniref:MBL fold metallo-hydrolase n=1 Tax=Iodidimonas sp. SYSU 1G8 TaxID=3133967 RepID=UPI0031FF0EEF
MQPHIKAFFDHSTSTFSYVVRDPGSRACAVIDPVLDYDPKSGRTHTRSADAIIAYLDAEGLDVEWILETHAHADHLTASVHLLERMGGRLGIGTHITAVQTIFGRLFNLGPSFSPDGRQFDRLFHEGDQFRVGGLDVRVMHTPGHTPACVTYVFDGCAFVGDTLFMPDYGTARADFPGGDARTLYRSIRRLLAMPPETRLFMCHDYLPDGRSAYLHESTVAAQRAGNIHVQDGISEDVFVAMREARDRTLEMPVLILPAIQVNIRAGHFPEPEANGVVYLKIPVNAV